MYSAVAAIHIKMKGEKEDTRTGTDLSQHVKGAGFSMLSCICSSLETTGIIGSWYAAPPCVRTGAT
jgi:hypothetical protein